MVKNFTLTFLLALILHFSGSSQEKFAVAARETSSVKIVKFYPNPATTNITFELPKGSSYTLQIFNFMGKKVYEIKSTTTSNFVNLNDFNRGVYIFQLRDASGKIVESGKFQVSK
ncbi:MAG: T9SS type A sorting domain-containing protein [Chitinophagaceae bacterium]|nr:T9SS type A sorting domain-containing protein [Chitinophagaceae bacterium]